MSEFILDRLNARIAVEPSLDHLDTLFGDLKDARDAIVASETPSPTPEGPAIPPSLPPSIDSALALLLEAQERLSVHALSTVGDNIAKAIKLLEG